VLADVPPVLPPDRVPPRRAELVIVDDTGHAPNATLNQELVRATDRLAGLP
jgi:hypothetical protein